jgi:hypothetical protein
MKRLPNLALCLAATLSACSFSPENHDYVASATDALVGDAIGGRRGGEDKKAAATADAVLVVPGLAGALIDKPYTNGWRRSMSLDGRKIAGDWNDLAIDMRFDGVSRAGAKIPMGPPTLDGIRREILARFPETPMRIVRRPMSNSLGPFGLAVGAEGDVRCVFAWQWVDDIRARPGEYTNWFQEKTPASIRLRLCRSGVTADELASLFERLETTDSGALDRVIAMWKETQDSGVAPSFVNIDGSANSTRTGLVVPDTTLEASLVGNRAKAIKIIRSSEETKVASAVGRPRRRLVRRAPTQHAAPVVQTALGSVPSRVGRRYLAPTEAQTRRVGAPPNGDAGFGQARLDPGLPAQAYLGPLPQSEQRAAVGASWAAPRYLGANGAAQ